MSTQTLAGGWTIEKLKALTVQKRHNVWKNARTRTEPDTTAFGAAILTKSQ